MALTLLNLVTSACNELGIKAPATVISNAAALPVQMLALANANGRSILREHEWRRCVLQYSYQTTASTSGVGNTTINSAVVTNIVDTSGLAAGMVVSGEGIPSYASILTVDSGTQITMDMAATETLTATALTFATQDYALPTGFERLISATNWDRSDHWMNLGPKSSQEWQWLQGGIIASGPRFRYRIYGNKMRFFPAPETVYNFAYEYVTEYFIIPNAGTVPTKSAFTADNDTVVFPDELFILGLKWRWMQAHSFPGWEIHLADYRNMLSTCKAQDQDNPTLSMAPQVTPILIGPYSVPDGNWNL